MRSHNLRALDPVALVVAVTNFGQRKTNPDQLVAVIWPTCKVRRTILAWRMANNEPTESVQRDKERRLRTIGLVIPNSALANTSDQVKVVQVQVC